MTYFDHNTAGFSRPCACSMHHTGPCPSPRAQGTPLGVVVGDVKAGDVLGLDLTGRFAPFGPVLGRVERVTIMNEKPYIEYGPPSFPSEWEVSTILKAAAVLSDRKRADYAGDDPDQNFIRAAEIGADICKGLKDTDPRRATAVLIGVKIARLRNLGLVDAANHESVDDTMDDLINYTALLKRQTLRARACDLAGA